MDSISSWCIMCVSLIAWVRSAWSWVNQRSRIAIFVLSCSSCAFAITSWARAFAIWEPERAASISSEVLKPSSTNPR